MSDALIYNLLNLEGLPVPNSYLEIKNFPAARPGQGTYFDQGGTQHEFTFVFNAQDCVFDAPLKSDTQKFFLAPVTNEMDEIVRFKVTFQACENHPEPVEVIFAWENENESDY